MDEEANAEFSEFVADKIRERVNDPAVAEKLIPKDHGFGMQRVPMETRYYEAYNRDNVHLVDINETPIERDHARPASAPPSADYEFDVIVYATGFDAITGAFDRIDIRRRRTARSCATSGATGPITYLGVQIGGLPQPDHAGRPAGRVGVDQLPPRHRGRRSTGRPSCSGTCGEHGYTRVEATAEAEEEWSRARQGDVRPAAAAQGQVVVHRLQLQRRGPRQDPLPRSTTAAPRATASASPRWRTRATRGSCCPERRGWGTASEDAHRPECRRFRAYIGGIRLASRLSWRPI